MSFIKRGSQKTGTMPDNDALMALLFGKKNVSIANNLIGSIIWLLAAIVCTVLFLRDI